jgi:hypothetical protein
MTQEARWRAAVASVAGTSHVRAGIGCQDAAVVKVFHESDGREVLVAVVSDGAGSASRAEAGSLLACATVAEAVEVFLEEGSAVAEIAIGTVHSWLAMVQEAIRGRADDEGAVPRDYACTLIAAIVGDDACAIFQVGDGAAVVPDAEGWCWVHWPQHGEYSNTTFFVTDDGAQDNLAFDLCQGRVNEIALFTDGIENLVLQKATKTVFGRFFDGMMPAVRALDGAGLDAMLSDSLAKYLESSAVCARTDDDKTLLLATRLRTTPSAPGGELASG